MKKNPIYIINVAIVSASVTRTAMDVVGPETTAVRSDSTARVTSGGTRSRQACARPPTGQQVTAATAVVRRRPTTRPWRHRRWSSAAWRPRPRPRVPTRPPTIRRPRRRCRLARPSSAPHRLSTAYRAVTRRPCRRPARPCPPCRHSWTPCPTRRRCPEEILPRKWVRWR